jgi:hypothetical protein
MRLFFRTSKPRNRWNFELMAGRGMRKCEVLKLTISDIYERRLTPINPKMGKTMPGSHPGGGILDGQDSLSSVHPEMKIFVQDQGMRKK